MAGIRMEIFRMGAYLSFPIGCMLYFGGPGYYNDYVAPLLKDRYSRPPGHISPATNMDDVKKQVEYFKEKRAAALRRIEADDSQQREQ
ncbi:hypothetical protein GQ42DRAFT_125058 [Ramicandelaber brevisporus]|nr:hypothetical protein GQ42DRAFT_125058 [Ramicandelaber brevisporus]